MHAAFSDSTEQTVVAIFSCPQIGSTWPYQDSIDATDARYAAFYESMQQGVVASLPAPAADA